jgi:gliding motility-associated-like protein
MRYLILLFSFWTSNLAFSQLETQNWYFGNNAGITFATLPPTALTNGAISTFEGSSTFSDNQGNLLFYTDGMFVYNRLHQQMPNGFGLLGNPSSAQSGVIVPKPGSLTDFYIFTVDAEGGPNGFRYSEVDITLDGGLGDVINSTKNTLLFAPSVEKVAAVAHANGIYYWVIGHGLQNNTYYAYLVDCNGISAPITSAVGQIEGNPGWGYLASSSDGTKLASAMCNQGFELLDFNNLTGVVSNPILLLNPSEAYGVSFSPNNQLLYGCKISGGEIYQWDLTAGTTAAIISSMQVIGIGQGSGYQGGAIQQGLDGKLYLPHFAQPYLSCIQNPNQVGAGCNLQHSAIDLQGRNAQLGLPPFVQTFFTPQANIISQATCNNVSFTLDPPIQGVDSILWNFGDLQSGALNSSGINSPSHIYPNAGNYTVTLIKYVECIADTIVYNFDLETADVYTTINVQTCDSTYLWNGQTLNQSGTYQETFTTLLGCDSTITLNLNLGFINPTGSSVSACEQYTWEGQNYTASGNYQSIFQSIYGCDSIISLDLIINPVYNTSIIQNLCEGEQFSFNGVNYSNPGTYPITLQSLQGCDSTVSLTIIEVPKPNQPTLSSEIPICANEDLKLYANPSLGTIQWTGPFNFSSTAWFNLIPAATAQSGTYSAWIVQNGCHSDTSDIYLTLQNLINSNEVKTPNVITPNNDQVNDYWDINETLKNCYDFELSIINRWGKLVFSGNKYGAKFTGIDDSGQTLINGVYFYTLTIENDIRHGFIHVTH